jgi:hypothetical protein
MFFTQDEILFLTFAEVQPNADLQLMSYDDRDFAESVLLGHWGSTSSFKWHVVIKILVSQIIYIRKVSSTTIAVWTFNAGHFLIRAGVEKIIQLSSFI